MVPWYLRFLPQKIPARQLLSILLSPKKWWPMDKKFAIFDMDGTLIDSMAFWKNLASEYISSKGVKQIPEDLPERIKPMTMSESAALFQQEFGLTGDPELK